MYWSWYKPTQNTLRKHRILKKLSSREDIVIVRLDKGSGVVILHRDIYDQKILEITILQSSRNWKIIIC